MRTIDDIKLINWPEHAEHAENGVLVPVEVEKQIPFKIKRLFYVFGVNSNSPRGKHAHYKTEQVLVCLNGKIECTCKDVFGREITVALDYPTKTIYIPEMIWDEQIYLSNGSILLSLCSTAYDPEDYIHNYEEFQNMKGEGGPCM